MKPVELTEIANGYFSYEKVVDEKTGEEDTKLTISEAEITLSPLHGGQFDELVGKLIEGGNLTEKPTVKRLSKAGALFIKAKDLISVLEACNKSGVELDNPS